MRDRLSIFDENFFFSFRLGMDDVTMIFIESVLLKTCSDADAQVADNSFHVGTEYLRVGVSGEEENKTYLLFFS